MKNRIKQITLLILAVAIILPSAISFYYLFASRVGRDFVLGPPNFRAIYLTVKAMAVGFASADSTQFAKLFEEGTFPATSQGALYLWPAAILLTVLIARCKWFTFVRKQIFSDDNVKPGVIFVSAIFFYWWALQALLPILRPYVSPIRTGIILGFVLEIPLFALVLALYRRKEGNRPLGMGRSLAAGWSLSWRIAVVRLLSAVPFMVLPLWCTYIWMAPTMALSVTVIPNDIETIKDGPRWLANLFMSYNTYAVPAVAAIMLVFLLIILQLCLYGRAYRWYEASVKRGDELCGAM